MSKLTYHQTQELLRLFNGGKAINGVDPKLSPPTRNALIALGYIDYNTKTQVITMTHEGRLVSSVLYVEVNK